MRLTFGISFSNSDARLVEIFRGDCYSFTHDRSILTDPIQLNLTTIMTKNMQSEGISYYEFSA
jgi:hypothetical protein